MHNFERYYYKLVCLGKYIHPILIFVGKANRLSRIVEHAAPNLKD